jgi:N-acylneuraminate cytidylyltransferase
MIIAVIPARGGSKRIPRKNLRLFAGKPIMAYSIEAARDARLFDRVVVSTDDEEIAATARAYGAETPFTRPAELSDDFTGTHAVAAHALTTLVDRAELDHTVVCCLYPTAPFVTPDDLRRGFDLLDRSGKSFVFAATTFAFPIQRALRALPDGGVAPFFPQWIESRSQDLEASCHDAGQFYWGRARAFCDGLPAFGSHAEAMILPRYRAMDIDTPEDWTQAELMYTALAGIKRSA